VFIVVAMQSETRSCNTCGETKPLPKFLPDRNMCRACKTEGDLARRKKNETSKSDANKSLERMFNNLIDVVNGPMSQFDQYKRIESLLLEALKINQIMMKDGGVMLLIPVEVSEILQNYLEQIASLFPHVGVECISYGKRMFTSMKCDEFQRIFDLDIDAVKACKDEMTNLEYMTSYVRTVYQMLLDEDNEMKYRLSESSQEPPRRQSVIRFDPRTRCIVADENPLKLNREKFMDGLVRLVENGIPSVVMYGSGGWYDKFVGILRNDS
jgi:hypothetical protein